MLNPLTERGLTLDSELTAKYAEFQFLVERISSLEFKIKDLEKEIVEHIKKRRYWLRQAQKRSERAKTYRKEMREIYWKASEIIEKINGNNEASAALIDSLLEKA